MLLAYIPLSLAVAIYKWPLHGALLLQAITVASYSCAKFSNVRPQARGMYYLETSYIVTLLLTAVANNITIMH